MPVDRSWTVPEDSNHLPDVSWTEDGDLLIQPRVVREDDHDATLEALLEALAILRRVGGTIQIASQRGEIAPEVVVTESYIFAYNSFTPLVRRLTDNPDAQPAFDQGAGADEAPAEDAASADDLAAAFPGMTEGQIGEAIAKANTEVPAEPETAAAVE